MSSKHEVGFTSTEIGALWSTYISESMNVCLLKYFLKHLKDEELRPLLSESLNTTQTYLEEVKNMFIQEKFPVPRGYTEEDVNLSAPPLFSDPISLSYYTVCARLRL
ncbi:DUF3231 family protein [Neobacillus drentensis]